MHVVIAPDSFKESLSAKAVAEAIGKGLISVLPDISITCVPVADGGEGTTEALVCSTEGCLMNKWVSDPYGDPIEAQWGLLGKQPNTPLTAVIEVAAASGLDKTLPQMRNPMLTSTYGTGELVLAALDQGVRRVIMGLGGSATNDGGVGFLKALGVKFLNVEGEPIPEGGDALGNLHNIDILGLDSRLQDTEFIVACDVDNPLLGENGASAIFGPQKGANPEQVIELDAALAQFAKVSCSLLGKDCKDTAGAGAAGGLGYALLQFLNARLQPGIDVVLEATDFDTALAKADLVITGEGKIDSQSLNGKAPVGVARWAKRHNLPVIALCGGVGKGAELVHEVGIDAVFPIVPHLCTLETALAQASIYLEVTAAQLGRVLSIGQKLKVCKFKSN